MAMLKEMCKGDKNMTNKIYENGIWMNNPFNCRIHRKAEHQEIPDENAQKFCRECDGCSVD